MRSVNQTWEYPLSRVAMAADKGVSRNLPVASGRRGINQGI